MQDCKKILHFSFSFRAEKKAVTREDLRENKNANPKKPAAAGETGRDLKILYGG